MAKKTISSYNRKESITLNRKPINLSKSLTTLGKFFISKGEIESVFGCSKCKNVLSRFIELNRENLKFLDIKIEESYDSGKPGLLLFTGRFAGAIPIKSPKTSLYTVDLKVKGSYSKSIEEDLLNSLLIEMDANLLPEFNDDLKLVGESVKAPLYLECENFIKQYLIALNINWTKFDHEIKIESDPRGATNWIKHAVNSFRPDQILRFENNLNIQTKDHKEWRQINYVLHKAIGVLESKQTPISARRRNYNILNMLKKESRAQNVETASILKIRATDPSTIKNLKHIANMILRDSSDLRRSWRIDISKLFEMYVQYILKKSGKDWKLYNNPHFVISGHHTSWSLSHLEPDLIMRKNDLQIIVDAKYKSHMLRNQYSTSDFLRETFRQDLHQVLAYTSLNQMRSKVTFLVYPVDFDDIINNKPKCKILKQKIESPFSAVTNNIYMIGLPFGPGVAKFVSEDLTQLLLKIERLNKID